MAGDYTAHSLHAPHGPLEGAVECGHGGPLFATDPPAAYVTPCDRGAVYRVALPASMGTLAVCRFHLARWAAAYPDRAARYRDRLGLNGYLPDRVWTTLTDVPPATVAAAHRWTRLGLDQRGLGHYYRDDDGQLVLAAFTPEWECECISRAPPNASLRDVLDHVADAHGWAAIDPDATATVTEADDAR